MTVDKQTYPSAKGDITLLTLTNASGAQVTLSSLGAGIVKVVVPDRQGKLENVAIGYPIPTDYYYDGPCAGKVPGRFANRIANGHFTLNGKTYTLAINNGPNALHGGPEGFQNQVWDVEVTSANHVVFTYRSADGEEGYPGNLTAKAEYEWTDDDTLKLELSAVTDADTVINLTNHVYFNLSGDGAGSVLDHELWLDADKWLPTDATQIPTGELAPVKGTPMDFTSPKAIGTDIKADFEALKIGKGYDHCWAVNDWKPGVLKTIARLSDSKSGRAVEIATTQPGAQVYTGNWLAGSPKGHCGRSYEDYDAVAIECQNFPDAPNKPGFPSPVLKPGEEFKQIITFKFTKQ